MNGKIKEAFNQVQAEEAFQSISRAKDTGIYKTGKAAVPYLRRRLCMLAAFSDWRTLALFYAYIRNQHRDKPII